MQPKGLHGLYMIFWNLVVQAYILYFKPHKARRHTSVEQEKCAHDSRRLQALKKKWIPPFFLGWEIWTLIIPIFLLWKRTFQHFKIFLKFGGAAYIILWLHGQEHIRVWNKKNVLT